MESDTAAWGVGRLILRFEDWVVSAAHETLGYQLDNETRELTLLGDLPQGWTWDVLVQAQGNADIWPLTLTEGGAKFTLKDENLSIKGPYCLQVRGTKEGLVRHCNVVTAYVLRTLVSTADWPTLPTEFAQAEENIKELNAHPPVPGENGYWMLWDLETSAYIESQLSVPVGPAGPANTLSIGQVETLEPGEPATAEISGEAPNQTLSLGIPQGQTGQTGATPALEIGQVETLEPGEPATAELSGTPEKPVLSLGIPQGQPGKDGPANTLSIGQVETLEPGEPATAEISGEAPNQTLSLGIPQGQTGQTGTTPELSIGQVETLEPGEPATAEITGETPNLVLNMGIPQGQPGQDGVQINDEAVNTTEAWSSKKILDTLCPPFTETGNPITCNPVEDYPLDVTVTMEPIQEGEGDPSPENVRPITGRDEVTVTRCGKNLLQDMIPQNITVSGIEWTITENSVTAVGTTNDAFSGTGGTSFDFTIDLYPKTYSLSYDVTDRKLALVAAISNPDGDIIWYLNNNPTYDVPGNGYKARFYAQVRPNITVNDTISNIQLELSSTPTAYEPYQGSTTTLTLPETIYGGTVDAVSGVGSKTWGYIASYNGESLPGEWISDRDVYAAGTTPTTGAQVAYKLATPEPFQATGNQALPAVAGLNTVYTDGDSLTVTGRRDLQTTMTAVTTLISEGGLT